VINGISDTEFGTGQVVSRQDMVLISYNAALMINKYAFREIGGTTDFFDMNEADAYAVHALMTFADCGIIQGVSENRIAPKEGVTRAQAAVIIERLMLFLNL